MVPSAALQLPSLGIAHCPDGIALDAHGQGRIAQVLAVTWWFWSPVHSSCSVLTTTLHNPIHTAQLSIPEPVVAWGPGCHTHLSVFDGDREDICSPLGERHSSEPLAPDTPPLSPRARGRCLPGLLCPSPWVAHTAFPAEEWTAPATGRGPPLSWGARRFGHIFVTDIVSQTHMLCSPHCATCSLVLSQCPCSEIIRSVGVAPRNCHGQRGSWVPLPGLGNRKLVPSCLCF